MNKIILLMVSLNIFLNAEELDEAIFECDDKICETLYVWGNEKNWVLDSIQILSLNGSLLWKYADSEVVRGDGRATRYFLLNLPVGDSVWVKVFSNHGLWFKKKKLKNEVFETFDED